MEFNSKRFFDKQSIEIKGSSVLVYKQGPLDSIEYEVPFENIATSKIVGVYAAHSAFISSFFCFIIAMLLLLVDSITGFLIFGFISTVTLFYGLITRVKMVTIPTYAGEDIKLYFNRNNRENAIEFADMLIERIKSFLKHKYSKFDRMMPLDKQFENLYFLQERGLISDSEYEEFKAYLLNAEKRSIGFGS